VRVLASDHGVRVAKWLGDGAMFVSTEPWPLLAAIVELERRANGDGVTLPIRGGLAGGEVILFEGDDYIGGPVNLAARLCNLAEPTEVLATAELGRFIPDGAESRPAGTRTVAGFVQPIEVVALTASEPITDTHQAIAG